MLIIKKIWVDYIKAHNIRDLDKIAEINSDEWEGYAPNGLTIKGNKAHIEFLDNWFKTSSPKWNIRWMIANSGEDENGEMTQWLTTANDLTDVDEQGNEIIEHHVHDVQFENGKIKRFMYTLDLKPKSKIIIVKKSPTNFVGLFFDYFK